MAPRLVGAGLVDRFGNGGAEEDLDGFPRFQAEIVAENDPPLGVDGVAGKSDGKSGCPRQIAGADHSATSLDLDEAPRGILRRYDVDESGANDRFEIK